MKRLLTRADDFGASPGTNEAIVAAIRAGLVRNVGIMAPGPWLGHRLEELLEGAGCVCLGLHATLNSEWAGLRWGPVLGAAAVPGLVRGDGSFHETVEGTHRHGDPEEGVREIRAQLEKLRLHGVEPQYLDCHMSFNWHPDWDRAIGELASEEGLVYHAHGLLPSVRLAVGKPPHPTVGDLLGRMETEGVGTAMWVFHPARRDAVSEQFCKDPDKADGTVADARDREYRFLTDSTSIQSFLSSKDLQLIRYDELAKQPEPQAVPSLHFK